MDTIGSRIRFLRGEASISQAKLGKQIGVSAGNVGEWEAGRSKPGADALIALSDFFNVTADWILTGKEYPKLNTQILEQLITNADDLVIIQKFLLLNERQKGKLEERIDVLLEAADSKRISSNSAHGEEAATDETA
ncbi:helix-turn-helix domain-containing protein [Lysinibacillus piscis]|uniref:Transcriptional regulator n=1 Tax=Lysinibacillus piscis TaxID=2518931 RepID=A0ABQ5NGW1_9BACI|nr:helix-turn-helix transcriptional regulator [Lysinibacillus sp. KH24]GLC87524.1 transcriptional regulator [Lysinibacillus sp. KH24]